MRSVVFWEFGCAILAQAWVGCSSQQTLDTEFAGYVRTFQEEVGNRLGPTQATTSKISVHFGKVPFIGPYNSEALAYCQAGNWQKRLGEVIVNKLEWSKLSLVQREALIFHELGHCVLGQSHRKGIMEPRLINPVLYQKHRKALIDDLVAGNGHPIAAPAKSYPVMASPVGLPLPVP